MYSQLLKQCNLSELNEAQFDQYKNSITSAFPKIIFKSQAIQDYWEKLEKYFPDFQLLLLDENEDVIGSINTIPFFWDRPISELPDEGWDWMLEKGVLGHENNLAPNFLGGLQVIVRKNYLGKGYSKWLIERGKQRMKEAGFDHLLIPIRPIFKHKHPLMKMEEYMQLKTDGVLYDPWIRTHTKSGAQIIKVCTRSMTIKGDVQYWSGILGQQIKHSGLYTVEGGLNPVSIQLEEDLGVYTEENIWICY